MKKILAVVLAMILSFSMMVEVFATEEMTEPISQSDAFFVTPQGVITSYDDLETAVCAAEEMVNAQYKDALAAAIQRGDDVAARNLRATMRTERHEAVSNVYAQYGFEKTDSGLSVSPMDTEPTDVNFNEDVYFNSPSSSYIYTCDWYWSGLRNDNEYDTYDIAGVGLDNSDDYYISRAFAKTWDNGGNQTGYVDDTGYSEPDSYISKRSESANGIAFNVKDEVKAVSTVLVFAFEGRMTIHVKKRSGVSGIPECKLIGSYEHNYKTSVFSFSAKIESVGFSTTGSLSVSYSRVNKHWLTAGGGAIISSQTRYGS